MRPAPHFLTKDMITTNVKIGDSEYPVKLGIGAMIRFQKHTGQDCTLFLEEMDADFAAAGGDPAKIGRVVFSRLHPLACLFAAAIENGNWVEKGIRLEIDPLELADEMGIADVGQIYNVIASTLSPAPPETGEGKPKSAKNASR